MKKKICFIAQFPPPMHGLSKAVETLYNSDLAQEYDFEKVNITNNKAFLSNYQKIKKSHADLYYFTISQSKGGNLRDLMILRLLRKQKKRCIVHLHGGYYRTLVDKHLPAWQRKANYKAISESEGAIVLGESLKWIFEGILPPERIYAVPNCVEDEYLMSDEDFEKKLNEINKREIRHILYLSNFIRSKGYAEVLELAKIEKEHCDSGEKRKFHFDFAGEFFEKTEKDFFFRYIKENQLEDYVTYHGFVSGEKKRALLKECDIFTLLTRYPNEGQPISILEAMGNGMVIITTDHAGIPDIVRNEIDGKVYKTIDTQEIYHDICKIDYEKFLSCGRAAVKNGYIEKIFINNMFRVFQTALK